MPEDPAELLALATRRQLYEVVRKAPGIGAREVQRAAGTGWGETVYHLERLTGAHLLHKESSERQDHYYAAEVPLADRRLLGLARSPTVRRVLVALLEVPSQTVPELTERTGVSPGRLSVHLRRLLEVGVLRAGRRERYRTFEVTDRERMVRLLITYREGLADDWVERLLETWTELFRP
jgi:predicted transcriptional regulator